jgi:cobalt transporter subunit CbtB
VNNPAVSSELQTTAVAAGHLGACAAALILGVALVFLVGFAHPTVLHNAAHDSRHALAFPCH